MPESNPVEEVQAAFAAGSAVAIDIELRNAILAGDSTAVNQFVTTNRTAVLRQAWRASGDRHLAEDIAQEVFVKAIRHMRSFKGDRPISHWLARITTNTAIDMLRKQRTQVSIDAENSKPLPSPGANPAESVEHRELQAMVRAAILRLPSDLREVIWMTVFNDMTYADAATALGLPMRTVMSRASTARARLRRSLGSAMDGLT